MNGAFSSQSSAVRSMLQLGGDVTDHSQNSKFLWNRFFIRLRLRASFPCLYQYHAVQYSLKAHTQPAVAKCAINFRINRTLVDSLWVYTLGVE
jgi:hypothetical protein